MCDNLVHMSESITILIAILSKFALLHLKQNFTVLISQVLALKN